MMKLAFKRLLPRNPLGAQRKDIYGNQFTIVQLIILTTISFNSEASSVPVLPTPTAFRL